MCCTNNVLPSRLRQNVRSTMTQDDPNSVHLQKIMSAGLAAFTDTARDVWPNVKRLDSAVSLGSVLNRFAFAVFYMFFVCQDLLFLNRLKLETQRCPATYELICYIMPLCRLISPLDLEICFDDIHLYDYLVESSPRPPLFPPNAFLGWSDVCWDHYGDIIISSVSSSCFHSFAFTVRPDPPPPPLLPLHPSLHFQHHHLQYKHWFHYILIQRIHEHKCFATNIYCWPSLDFWMPWNPFRLNTLQQGRMTMLQNHLGSNVIKKHMLKTKPVCCNRFVTHVHLVHLNVQVGFFSGDGHVVFQRVGTKGCT